MAANLDYTMTTISDVRWVDIPKIEDAKGNLSVLEGHTIPFEMRRVYYLYDVPSIAERYGNAHRQQQQLLVALSGSFEVLVKDGRRAATYKINRPNQGLYLPNGIWREMHNFSSGAVCLVLASDVFDEADYIRDFDAYRLSKDGI